MLDHTVSVVVTSYNQPNTLRLVLAGFAAQTDTDFEMTITDDGSDSETLDVVAAFKETAPFDVTFVTQEHTGFRKVRALNSAILASNGRQLIFCDGDCVPFLDLVAAYRRSFRPGEFLAGGCRRLGLEDSRALTPEAISKGKHHALIGWADRARMRSVHWKNLLYRLTGKRNKPKIVGGNMSVDRELLLRVDGFDEQYCGLSAEDSDLRNRMCNAGASGISLWHRALVCHLDHKLDERGHLKKERIGRRDPAVYYSSLERVRAVKGLSSRTAS